MSDKFFLQVEQFMDLGNSLHTKGVKKKEIARQLGLFPSAYSALLNIVFQRLVQPSDPIEDERKRIQLAFSGVNNVSEKRIRREMSTYLLKMKELDQEMSSIPLMHDENITQQLVQNSPETILEKLKGMYFCYYISTFGYEVKREPFLIYQDQNQQFLVKKGNRLSQSRYRGTIFLSNSHLVSMQLLEEEQVQPDHFFVHISLPPSYSPALNLLKGIALSMANSHSPIGRKFILEKVSTQISGESYQQMETSFYPQHDQDSPIPAYLYRSVSVMEYLPVPRPAFSTEDLERELQISEILQR